jgi:purine nucleosidase
MPVLQKTVIIDGDWGGDEMQLAAVLLAHPEAINVIGATTLFGNTDHHQALRNAGDILYFLNAAHIPFFAGEKGPGDERVPEGDNAHGENGLGGVFLHPTPSPPQAMNAVDFILGALRNALAGTVTITATGPLPNIARAIEKDRHTMRRVLRILVMGGCTTEIPASDMPLRRGNITPDSEFNFYMAAKDARTVMESGLPITLFPMNCTHQLTFTPERAKAIEAALAPKYLEARTIIHMMRAPTRLDSAKFNSAPIMHDVHTALYLLYPDQYVGRSGYVDVKTMGAAIGRTDFLPDQNGAVMVMETIKDPDALFTCVVDSITKRLLSG